MVTKADLSMAVLTVGFFVGAVPGWLLVTLVFVSIGLRIWAAVAAGGKL